MEDESLAVDGKLSTVSSSLRWLAAVLQSDDEIRLQPQLAVCHQRDRRRLKIFGLRGRQNHFFGHMML